MEKMIMKKGIVLLSLVDYESFDDEPLGLCFIAAN